MTNSIDEIYTTDCMFLIGTNTTENHPVISIKMKQAVIQGNAKLIVADPRKIDMVGFADIWLRQKPGTDVALINGLMNVIIEEGLVAERYVNERTENLEGLKEAVKSYTPEYVEEISGVPRDDIRKAARLYAGAHRGSIYYAMGITQHTTGTDNVKSLANLAMLCGNVGIEGGGVNPLRGKNNVQGACDLGVLPNVYPAYQNVEHEDIRAKFEHDWKVSPLSCQPGLTLTDMKIAAARGDLKALYIMGENLLLSNPDLNHIEKALDNLEFMVVQDIFMTETAKLADVVLPAVSFAEKDGTVTNTERRVQRIAKAIAPPEQALPDWKIISDLATRMGYEMAYESPEDIFSEIRTVTPSYAGMSYERIAKKGGLQWPCPSEDHPGTQYLHKEKFARGKGLFHAINFIPPAELPDEAFPLLLSTGRVLYHYHTGTMTRKDKALSFRYPNAYVEMNPADTNILGIQEEEIVRVSSRRGTINIAVKITQRSPKGVVFIPFHFIESPANRLTNPAFDPIGKIPEFKVCAVKVEKIS